MPRPKNHYRTGKYSELLKDDAPYFCMTKTGDIDKLLRSTLDGLSVSSGGSVIMDDSLVVSVKALKRYAARYELAGANINVKTFDKVQ